MLEPRQALLEALHESAREALRFGERELAELGARARDGAAPERRGVQREAGVLELARQGLGVLAANVRDQEILHAGRPEGTRAVAIREVGGDPQLVRREPASQHGDAHVAIARLPLRVDTDVVAICVVRRLVGHTGREGSAQTLLDRGLEAVGRPAVLEEQELEPGSLAVLPERVRVAEDLGDRAEDRQRLRLGHEGVEPDSKMGIGREPAADADGEADLTGRRVAHRREADVVDLGIGAPGSAPRDRDLELPRQVVERGVAVHELGRLHDERRGVDQLLGVETRHRAAGDIARDVAARAHGGHALKPERLEHVRQALERHPVELEILAHGDVGDAAAVPLGEVGDRPDLPRLEHAVGNADSHHQVPNRLALAALAPDRAHAVALRVDAPPAEVRAEPLGGHKSQPSRAKRWMSA